MRWDLRKNERDLSEPRVLKAIRHLAVVGFNLSGNAAIVRPLEMECSEMARRLGETGSIATLEGFKYGSQTQPIDCSDHKNASRVERTTRCMFPFLYTVVQPNVGRSAAICPKFNQFQVVL